MKSIRFFILATFFFTLLSTNAQTKEDAMQSETTDKFKIKKIFRRTKTAPMKIKIDNKEYGIGDMFSADQIIEWNNVDYHTVLAENARTKKFIPFRAEKLNLNGENKSFLWYIIVVQNTLSKGLDDYNPFADSFYMINDTVRISSSGYTVDKAHYFIINNGKETPIPLQWDSDTKEIVLEKKYLETNGLQFEDGVIALKLEYYNHNEHRIEKKLWGKSNPIDGLDRTIIIEVK